MSKCPQCGEDHDFIRITYKNTKVDAPRIFVKNAKSALSKLPDELRRIAMPNVIAQLDDCLEAIRIGAPDFSAHMFILGITTWYANEVIEGRAVLEESIH